MSIKSEITIFKTPRKKGMKKIIIGMENSSREPFHFLYIILNENYICENKH